MHKALILPFFVTLAAASASADQIEATLQSALKAYQAGDVKSATADVTRAGQLLKAMKENALQGFLPAAPAGWTRTFDKEAAAGASAVGGTAAAADYANGTYQFTVTIMSDSPILPGIAAMFANPAVMATQGKLLKVGPEKFIAQDDNQVTGVIDNRVVVQAEGASAGVMVPVLAKIDFARLGRFGR